MPKVTRPSSRASPKQIDNRERLARSFDYGLVVVDMVDEAAADTPRKMVDEAEACAAASMRPRQIRRGNENGRVSCVKTEDASMRPRQIRRGNRTAPARGAGPPRALYAAGEMCKIGLVEHARNLVPQPPFAHGARADSAAGFAPALRSCFFCASTRSTVPLPMTWRLSMPSF